VRDGDASTPADDHLRELLREMAERMLEDAASRRL
jgi:hypothetical protein